MKPRVGHQSSQQSEEPQFDESYYEPFIEFDKRFAKKLKNPRRFVLITTFVCVSALFAKPLYDIGCYLMTREPKPEPLPPVEIPFDKDEPTE